MEKTELSLANGIPLLRINSNNVPALIRADQSAMRVRSGLKFQVNPVTSGVEVTFGGTAGFVEFQIQPTEVEESNFFLHFRDVVTGAPVEAITFLEAIDTVEIRSSANVLLQSIPGKVLWLMYGLVSTDQLSTILSGNVINMDTSLEQTGPIPIGSRERKIRLMGLFASICRLRVFTKVMNLRINFKNNIAINGTSNSNIKFSDFRLIVKTENVLPQESKIYTDAVNSRPLLLPYADFVIQNFPSKTLTASVASERFRLSGLIGNFGEVFVIFTKNSSANESDLFSIGRDAVFSNSDTDSNAVFKIYDSMNAIKGSVTGVDAKEARYDYFGDHSHSQIAPNQPVYAPISLSDDPFSLMHKGTVSGVETFKGEETLEITPGASWVTASDYNIIVIGVRIAKMLIYHKTGEILSYK